MQQTRCINCMKEIAPGTRTCPHCGCDQQAEQVPYALRPNTILHGRYLVGRVIGKGGFGITYVGFDLMLEVKVAIKEYYPSGVASRNNSWSNQVVWESQNNGLQGQDAQARRQESMERVLKEARRTAKLAEVPTVVRVNEVFQENETAYIIMDFIEGITLKDYLIQNGAMSWEDCQRLHFPVMDALAQAHDLGIVHRDISPDNIMIEPDGTVRLLDLGAAVDINANHGLASTGVVKSNFSPLEQYDENGKIGSWTDVYAFAATLYYCLTGKLMTPVLDRIRNPEITFPEGFNIPEEVKDALRRALAIYEDERTQDMREFQRELLRGDNAPKPGAWSQQNGPAWANGQGGPYINPQNSGIHDSARTFGQRGAGSEAQKTAEEGKAEDSLSPSMRTTKKKGKTNHSNSKKSGIILMILWIAMVAGLLIQGVRGLTSKELMSDWALPSLSFTYTAAVADDDVFGSEYLRKEITSITFLDTLENEPDDSWDVSKWQFGKVKAWVEEEDGECRLYIAAEGGSIVAPENCSGLFCNYTNCTKIDLSELDTSKVADMYGMFSNCSGLTELDVSGFDTSQVTDMSYMFYGCESLTELDVSRFDTSKVTDMSSMFYSCESLTELDVSGFDTSQVTDMRHMFYGCESLTELDVSRFDTSKVTDMSSMFYSCESLKELDVSGFDTSQVTDMRYMFYGCESLTELDVSEFDTSQVTDMGYMFYGCESLTELDVSSFDTSNVTEDMNNMFRGCSSLTILILWPDCSDSLREEMYEKTGSSALAG